MLRGLISFFIGTKLDLTQPLNEGERITSGLRVVGKWSFARLFTNTDALRVAESIKNYVISEAFNQKYAKNQKQALANVSKIFEKLKQASPHDTDKLKAIDALRNQILNTSGHINNKTNLPSLAAIASANPPEKPGAHQATYFDMGGLSSCIWNFIQWLNAQNAEVFNTESFSNYLTSLFSSMKDAGMTQIDLAFSQIVDINALVSGDLSNISNGDVIGTLLSQMKSSKVEFPPGTDVLKLITDAAQQSGITTCISFGGETAAPDDFNIGDNPEELAQNLVKFMNNYNVSSVDFDVEGANASTLAHQPNAVTFFKTLHDTLIKQTPPKTSTLTIQGSLTQTVWGRGRNGPSSFDGPLKPLFYDSSNSPIVSSLFNGINLMMYDSGQHYYLDPKVASDDTTPPDWCVEDWIDIVGEQNSTMLSIGFQDATAYQLASSSASGHAYANPPSYCPKTWGVLSTDSSGTAAAKIFLQIQAIVNHDKNTAPLGEPFWWPNYDGSRYAPGPGNSSQFISQPMQDFYTTLKTLGNQ